MLCYFSTRQLLVGENGNEEVVYGVETVKDIKVWICCPVCGNKLFTGKSFEDISIKCPCGAIVKAEAKHLQILINVESLKLRSK